MVGGRFQGSNIGPTSDSVGLAAIVSPPEGRYSELTFLNAWPDKFLRCYAPPGSYGDIAELEVYHDGVKIRGKPFGTYRALSSGSTYVKAFAGKALVIVTVKDDALA